MKPEEIINKDEEMSRKESFYQVVMDLAQILTWIQKVELGHIENLSQ